MDIPFSSNRRRTEASLFLCPIPPGKHVLCFTSQNWRIQNSRVFNTKINEFLTNTSSKVNNRIQSFA